MAERIAAESQALPYRWGYFHGAIQIPWSLLAIVPTILHRHNPKISRYVLALTLLIGLIGLPLGIGLLLKRKFALPLVYATFALAVLFAASQIRVALAHFPNAYFTGVAVGETALPFFWLCCSLYYWKRRFQFR